MLLKPTNALPRIPLFLPLFFLVTFAPAAAQQRPGSPPLEEWKAAVVAGDAAKLLEFYSTSPAAQTVVTDKSPSTPESEAKFWASWKERGLTGAEIEVAELTEMRTGVFKAVFTLELRWTDRGHPASAYFTVAQLWQKQGEVWRLVISQRSPPSRLKQPLKTNAALYPPGADAKAEIAAALERAARDQKRVLVVFGADWCFDCHVLEEAFHRPDIAPLLGAGFEVVHVDIGTGDLNQDLMKKYEVPLDKGIPAIAVLESDGKLLHSQRNGEFESARSLGPDDLIAFLGKWKPRKEVRPSKKSS